DAGADEPDPRAAPSFGSPIGAPRDSRRRTRRRSRTLPRDRTGGRPGHSAQTTAKGIRTALLSGRQPGKGVHSRRAPRPGLGADVFVVDRTVDVHVRKIREKIGSDFIETVKGVG